MFNLELLVTIQGKFAHGWIDFIVEFRRTMMHSTGAYALHIYSHLIPYSI